MAALPSCCTVAPASSRAENNVASSRTRTLALRFASGLAVALAFAAVVLAIGCAGPAEHTESRPLLGTTVSMTLYGDASGTLLEAADRAFAAMEQVEAALNPYDPETPVSAINADPYGEHVLPDDAREILKFIDSEGVGDHFDPTLYGVTRLYGFGSGGSVPEPGMLERTLAMAGNAEWGLDFSTLVFEVHGVEGAFTHPGLDLGGASKGLALDRALEVLEGVPGLEGALVSAGSSTLVLGSKPDGTPWRVGVEDPRDTGSIVATFEIELDGTDESAVVSTSGDYQEYFERDGTRYHHILDPATGQPARGLRSMTVASIGESSLWADVMSTVLFVTGADEAADHATGDGFALYAVDDEGRALVVPGPEGSGLLVEEVGEPTP